jgi:hypothetical protein
MQTVLEGAGSKCLKITPDKLLLSFACSFHVRRYMTERLSIFTDRACTVKEEERETYLRRRDKLSERVVFPLKSNSKVRRCRSIPEFAHSE